MKLKEFKVGDKVYCSLAVAKSATASRYSVIKYISNDVVVLCAENHPVEFTTDPNRSDMSLWRETVDRVGSSDKGSLWKVTCSKELFIFAEVDLDKFCFVSINNGNRWQSPQTIDLVNVSLKQYAGSSLALVRI